MESPGPKHQRNVSRSSRPRSSTKGPLDEPNDFLDSENLNVPSTSRAGALHGGVSGESFTALDPLAPDELPSTLGKNLSFLLRYDIYHPLSQLDIPPALRSEFIGLTPDEPLASSLGSLERQLAEGHFLLAAYLCAAILTSPLMSPTDIKVIFALFYTRLACLEISGNAVLAAQESKALEDLSSTFYYVESDPQAPEDEAAQGHPKHTRHIVPWPLRVLAVRLQSIGFGDSRRGIGGLYEIGLEARREIMRPGVGEAERKIWQERLADLKMRTANALIEMGDFDAARLVLPDVQTSEPTDWANQTRKALLFLAIGDLDAAKRIIDNPPESQGTILKPLLSMTEGRYSDAVTEWQALLESEPKRPDEAMISQNLAVCLLYTGELNKSRELLESLVSANHSFCSLVFNLSTVYELCSDKSGQMKAELVEKVSEQPVSEHANLDRPNADFKL